MARSTTCQHEAAQIVESNGAVEGGRFREKYECPCGATGVVMGHADAPPQEWDRRGRVFDDE